MNYSICINIITIYNMLTKSTSYQKKKKLFRVGNTKKHLIL